MNLAKNSGLLLLFSQESKNPNLNNDDQKMTLKSIPYILFMSTCMCSSRFHVFMVILSQNPFSYLLASTS